MNNTNITVEKMNSPFTFWCQKVIPLTFDDSLSYYELLCKVVAQLNTMLEVVNNNGDAVSELQTLYAELKSYVDNYFTNLNVQTQINTKLDLMASDGTLATIINEEIFAELNQDIIDLGNTVTANKTATDDTIADIEASIGDLNNTINENKTASDNSIAELNDELESTNLSIDEIVNNLNDKKLGLIAISRSTKNNDHYLYYSSDGEKFYRVGNKIDNLVSDASALININGRYYYFGNNLYQFSDDLVNWTEEVEVIPNSNIVWACYPFYDQNSNKYYVYSSYQYKVDNATNIFGNTYYFKIICQEFTVNADGSLTFGSVVNVKYTDNQSYIDPSICYDPIHGYIFALKNELTCKIELYHASSPTTIDTNPYATLNGAGTEGPQLLSNNGFITMYVHDYALGYTVNTGLASNLPETFCKVDLSCPTILYGSTYINRHVCQMPEIFRHAGIITCNKKSLNLITSIGVHNTRLFKHDDYRFKSPVQSYYVVAVAGATFNLPNFPDTIFQLGGGSTISKMTVNLRAYFDEPLKIVTGPTNLQWGGDADFNENLVINEGVKDHLYMELPIALDNHIVTPIDL